MSMIDMRISKINTYLEKIRDDDVRIRYKWRLELTDWLELEGIPRQAAYDFSSTLYLGSQCSDKYHEVIRAMSDNEEINQFFKPWLEKYLEGQAQG